MIEIRGSRPSLPTRSNSRPRWARWPSGRARSMRPNAVTETAVTARPMRIAQPQAVAGDQGREHEDRGGEGDDAAHVRAPRRHADHDQHRSQQPDGGEAAPAARPAAGHERGQEARRRRDLAEGVVADAVQPGVARGRVAEGRAQAEVRAQDDVRQRHRQHQRQHLDEGEAAGRGPRPTSVAIAPPSRPVATTNAQ